MPIKIVLMLYITSRLREERDLFNKSALLNSFAPSAPIFSLYFAI